MKTASHVTEARNRHHAALASLYLATTGKPFTGEPVQLWRKLAHIERDANNAATAQCNGAPYGGQPYRADDDDTPGGGYTAYEAFCDSIRSRVAKVFGGTLPAGFKLNHDPRGYSLKLDKDKGATIPAGLCTDWGGYGILAPVID